MTTSNSQIRWVRNIRGDLLKGISEVAAGAKEGLPLRTLPSLRPYWGLEYVVVAGRQEYSPDVILHSC